MAEIQENYQNEEYIHRLEDEQSVEEYETYFCREIEKYQSMIDFKPKKGYEIFKRVIDIVVSLIAIIPVSFLIVILSVIIYIDSPGHPIFSQVRVGKNGKLIRIHKLRSMSLDAEENGQKWAEENDCRITRVGSFIRKYRLDEIPQFFDVLTGTLSLIGPRPEVPGLTVQFNEENPGFVTRLMVTPGISGWAQVHGGYYLSPKEKWIEDNYYIENRSIKMYFQIFLKTISTVITGEDAK